MTTSRGEGASSATRHCDACLSKTKAALRTSPTLRTQKTLSFTCSACREERLPGSRCKQSWTLSTAEARRTLRAPRCTSRLSRTRRRCGTPRKSHPTFRLPCARSSSSFSAASPSSAATSSFARRSRPSRSAKMASPRSSSRTCCRSTTACSQRRTSGGRRPSASSPASSSRVSSTTSAPTSPRVAAAAPLAGTTGNSGRPRRTGFSREVRSFARTCTQSWPPSSRASTTVPRRLTPKR
mmetsp:Transcript_13791/g.28402  ORF Transcript_13791/g.28402 Transcript_13791/m.28402 type:complete len:239 (+) Transcript_13791:1136-1852(+)